MEIKKSFSYLREFNHGKTKKLSQAKTKRRKYMIPLVPPITRPIEDPISFTVSATSFNG